jgi:glycerol-3-phosphate responsive antiterminator
MDNERRTLEELVTRYQLEPELRDIYVEGKTDKILLEWFLKQKGVENFAVYEIDTVEISTQKLFEYGLNDSNRSRAIALALEIQNQAELPHFTCIADKDFDWLFGKNYTCNSLLFSDYTSLEMYLFNEFILDKFFRLSLRLTKLEAKTVLNKLSQILEEVFLIRATNEALLLNMEWLQDFGGCCQIHKNEIRFDSGIFIQKYLNKNSKMSEKLLFITKLEELRTKKLKDRRYQIHGHDFIELLCLYIRPYLRKEIKNSYNSEILAGGLLGCVDADYLMQETLFQKLFERMNN